MTKIKPISHEKSMVNESATMKDCINSLNASTTQIVLVVDDTGRFIGTVTDGDIRRELINAKSLDTRAGAICNRHPKYVLWNDPPEKAEHLCRKHAISRVPVVDPDGKPVGIYRIEDFIPGEDTTVSPKPYPVIIMAGGQGTRLDPFTRILPKPLIPIGNKAVIEHIIDRYVEAGFSNFIISVNYRKEFIRIYFTENEPLPYSLRFITEDKPLGTIGSLSLMKEMLTGTFIVANCDMVLDVNWEEVMNFHSSRGNAITMIGALKDFQIPYGVIDIRDEEYQGIIEKPQYNFLINLGVYIMEPAVLDLLAYNEPLPATELLDLAGKKGMKIGVFPIYNNWFDVGQWEDYRNTLKHFE